MVKKPNIYLALPVMEEFENMKKILEFLKNQTYPDFSLYVCVNQYDNYWQDEEKKHICIDNAKTLKLLKENHGVNAVVIDKSSVGKGWSQKKGGVGWARKILMDAIVDKANSSDIIISIDADTYYPKDYVEKISSYFTENPHLYGLAVPYYHQLSDDKTNKLILRYELYMRYYILNMIRINSPYSFTAVGSAMAFPVWAYKKVGGLTPVPSGEDFYFLQKLVKSGPIGIWIDTVAYPSSRLSSRVVFGTGPALIKGASGDWDSYPFYNYMAFDEIGNSYSTFNELYDRNIPLSIDDFLSEQFKTRDIWEPLRRNYNDRNNFIRACSNKIDALRILQFLRFRNDGSGSTEKNLFVYLRQFYNNEQFEWINKSDYERLDEFSIRELSELRFLLYLEEKNQRKTRFLNHYNYHA